MWLRSGLATLSINQKDFDRATIFLSVIECIYCSIGAHLSLEEQNNYENMVSIASVELGNTNFVTLWADGQEVSFDQIVDFSIKIQ